MSPVHLSGRGLNWGHGSTWHFVLNFLLVQYQSVPVLPLPWEPYHCQSYPDPQPEHGSLKSKRCVINNVTCLSLRTRFDPGTWINTTFCLKLSPGTISVSSCSSASLGTVSLSILSRSTTWTRELENQETCNVIMSPVHLSRRGLPRGYWGHGSPPAPLLDSSHSSNRRGSHSEGRWWSVLLPWHKGDLQSWEWRDIYGCYRRKSNKSQQSRPLRILWCWHMTRLYWPLFCDHSAHRGR